MPDQHADVSGRDAGGTRRISRSRRRARPSRPARLEEPLAVTLLDEVAQVGVEQVLDGDETDDLRRVGAVHDDRGGEVLAGRSGEPARAASRRGGSRVGVCQRHVARGHGAPPVERRQIPARDHAEQRGLVVDDVTRYRRDAADG